MTDHISVLEDLRTKRARRVQALRRMMNRPIIDVDPISFQRVFAELQTVRAQFRALEAVLDLAADSSYRDALLSIDSVKSFNTPTQ